MAYGKINTCIHVQLSEKNRSNYASYISDTFLGFSNRKSLDIITIFSFGGSENDALFNSISELSRMENSPHHMFPDSLPPVLLINFQPIGGRQMIIVIMAFVNHQSIFVIAKYL